MKRAYIRPEADKISFNYRDQVVAASSSEPEDGFMENSVGIGSPLCGPDGIVDRLFDYVGSNMCV